MVVGVGDNLKIRSSCFGGIFAVWRGRPIRKCGPAAGGEYYLNSRNNQVYVKHSMIVIKRGERILKLVLSIS